MNLRIAGFAVLIVAVFVLVASPASAIGPEFFQNYVFGGAFVYRVASPFGTTLLSVNFRPGEFSAADASAIFQGLGGLVSGITIVNSFGPADLASVGVSPVQVIQALQLNVNPSGPFTKLFILDIYRRPPSGIGLDVYRWFGPNDFRYVITLGS